MEPIVGALGLARVEPHGQEPRILLKPINFVVLKK
jgi:hypothetical protein